MSFDPFLKQIYALQENTSPYVAKDLHGNLITLLNQKPSNKFSPVVKSVLSKKPKRILDIGCGHGALGIFFAMHGIETVGIDLRDDAMRAGSKLAQALGLENITFSTMDACAISLSGFDIALSTDFFEHLPYESQPAHLRSVWQALNAGGVYISAHPIVPIFVKEEMTISDSHLSQLYNDKRLMPDFPSVSA